MQALLHALHSRQVFPITTLDSCRRCAIVRYSWPLRYIPVGAAQSSGVPGRYMDSCRLAVLLLCQIDLIAVLIIHQFIGHGGEVIGEEVLFGLGRMNLRLVITMDDNHRSLRSVN